MKTIVALVDFSDLTFKVLKQAQTLAKAFNGEVTILHMVPKEPALVGGGVIAPTIMQAPSPEVVRQHHAKLDEMRDSLVKLGIRASVQQLDGADVNDVLIETKKLNADLIVIGSHHHGAFYNMFIGSVTSDVLKRAQCPVLVVPSDNGAQEKRN